MPNFHACRIREPGEFQAGSFRTLDQEADGKPIKLVIGRLKGKTETTLQSFRYPKGFWDEGEARSHCNAHEGILFEPATGEEEMRSVQLVELEARLREIDLQALDDYKAGKGGPPMIYKATGYLKAGATIEQPMVFVASDETQDRVGDDIAVAGWELGNFKRNPVLMFSHDYTLAPIGTVPKVWAEGKQLLNTVKFDDGDEFALFIKGKYERKVMRAVSVGFSALEFEHTETGIHFNRQELWEISAVAVPAHPLALAKAMGSRRFGIIVPEQIPFTQESTEKGGTVISKGALSPANAERLNKARALLDEVLTLPVQEGDADVDGQELADELADMLAAFRQNGIESLKEDRRNEGETK